MGRVYSIQNMPLLLCLMFQLFNVITPSECFSDLGGHENKIEDEKKHFKSKSHTRKQKNGYIVHELVLEGAKVKEYATPAGVVFAVSWKGMATPDLRALFGNYYEEYAREKANLKIEKGRRNLGMNTNNLVIRQGGSMREQRGFAYVPSEVPPGVNIDNLE